MIQEMKKKFSAPIVPMKRTAAVRVKTIADTDFEDKHVGLRAHGTPRVVSKPGKNGDTGDSQFRKLDLNQSNIESLHQLRR